MLVFGQPAVIVHRPSSGQDAERWRATWYSGEDDISYEVTFEGQAARSFGGEDALGGANASAAARVAAAVSQFVRPSAALGAESCAQGGRQPSDWTAEALRPYLMSEASLPDLRSVESQTGAVTNEMAAAGNPNVLQDYVAMGRYNGFRVTLERGDFGGADYQRFANVVHRFVSRTGAKQFVELETRRLRAAGWQPVYTYQVGAVSQVWVRALPSETRSRAWYRLLFAEAQYAVEVSLQANAEQPQPARQPTNVELVLGLARGREACLPAVRDWP